jgi:hypothetical protein
LLYDVTCWGTSEVLPDTTAILHISQLHGQGSNIHGHEVIIVTTGFRVSLLSKVDFSTMILQKDLGRHVEDMIGPDSYREALESWYTGTYFQFVSFPLDDLFTPLQLLGLRRCETIDVKECSEEIQDNFTYLLSV